MTIGIIGTGRMSRVFLHNLQRTQNQVLWVWGRNSDKALELSQKHDILSLQDLDNPPSVDMVILAISDRALAEVSEYLDVEPETIIVHLSGASSIDLLHMKHRHRAVLWPIDSFSVNEQSMAESPLICEASDAKTETEVLRLASELSTVVKLASSAERSLLHLVAVMVNNFSNHLLRLSENILENTDFKLDLFEPILKTTIDNALSEGASNSQTGPAIRRDSLTIERHLELLPTKYHKLYKTLTRSIQNIDS